MNDIRQLPPGLQKNIIAYTQSDTQGQTKTRNYLKSQSTRALNNSKKLFITYQQYKDSIFKSLIPNSNNEQVKSYINSFITSIDSDPSDFNPYLAQRVFGSFYVNFENNLDSLLQTTTGIIFSNFPEGIRVEYVNLLVSSDLNNISQIDTLLSKLKLTYLVTDSLPKEILIRLLGKIKSQVILVPNLSPNEIVTNLVSRSRNTSTLKDLSRKFYLFNNCTYSITEKINSVNIEQKKISEKIADKADSIRSKYKDLYKDIAELSYSAKIEETELRKILGSNPVKYADNMEELLRKKLEFEMLNSHLPIPTDKIRSMVKNAQQTIDQIKKLSSDIDSLRFDLTLSAKDYVQDIDKTIKTLESLGIKFPPEVKEISKLANEGFLWYNGATSIVSSITSGNYLGAVMNLGGLFGGGSLGIGGGPDPSIMRELGAINQKLDEIIETQKQIIETLNRVESKLDTLNRNISIGFSNVYKQINDTKIGIGYILEFLNTTREANLNEIDKLNCRYTEYILHSSNWTDFMYLVNQQDPNEISQVYEIFEHNTAFSFVDIGYYNNFEDSKGVIDFKTKMGRFIETYAKVIVPKKPESSIYYSIIFNARDIKFSQSLPSYFDATPKEYDRYLLAPEKVIQYCDYYLKFFSFYNGVALTNRSANFLTISDFKINPIKTQVGDNVKGVKELLNIVDRAIFQEHLISGLVNLPTWYCKMDTIYYYLAKDTLEDLIRLPFTNAVMYWLTNSKSLTPEKYFLYYHSKAKWMLEKSLKDSLGHLVFNIQLSSDNNLYVTLKSNPNIRIPLPTPEEFEMGILNETAYIEDLYRIKLRLTNFLVDYTIINSLSSGQREAITTSILASTPSLVRY